MRYRNCAEALRVLQAGMDEIACHDFGAIRQVALCQAWETFETQQADTFHTAVRQAWNAIDAKCAAHGGTKPETGFLAGVTKREQPGECPVCPMILAAHCDLHGDQDPTFCELLDRYYMDPGLTTDDLMLEVSRIATPEQMREVGAKVNAHLARMQAAGAVA